MFERYTEEAKELIGCAQLEARHLGHNMLGPEHLLLGALRTDGPLAAVLAQAGLSHPRAIETLRHFRGAEVPPPEGHVPFSDAGRAALGDAMTIADERGDRHIGAEHIMLAVTCAEVDLTARVLAEMSVDVAALRDRLAAEML
ncbi:hypothetical protein ASG82_11180 [Mycobacterium sp. Soil538]|nr:hypothetical protein ASG82_11180 [Mycobacterium sp. Soil538]